LKSFPILKIKKRSRKNFPKKSVERRNTGYALDMLLDSAPFGGTGAFNMCKLIAGSEGTLCFLTEIKLNIIPPPPKAQGLVCVHFDTIDDALHATIDGAKIQAPSCRVDR
jgi:FAD/FMN-containing dehydrogenase